MSLLSRFRNWDALLLAFYFYHLSHNERREDTYPPLIVLQPQHIKVVHRSLSCWAAAGPWEGNLWLPCFLDS